MTEVIARTLQAYQIDTKALYTRHGLDPEPFRNPDGRISVATMDKIWIEAEKLSGNPCIGFEVGRAIHATNLHAVGYAWMASATLREAMQRLVRYQRVISTAGDMELAESDSIVEFEFERDDDVPHRGGDAAFTAIVQLSRDVSYDDFSPLSVHMVRPAPPCAPRLAEFFHCPIHYGANANKICFSADSLDEPLNRNNPALVQASEEVARDYLANMDKKDVVTRARVVLIGRLPNGEPNRKAVAEALAMSERTLARRLAERDYTFTSLVDETRDQLAKEYLRQSRFSVTDVAFLLGFSDQSNFARAFKRWTGQSPSEFRTGGLATA